MEKTRIVIIEDSEQIRSLAKRALIARGHLITGEAATLRDGLALLDSIASGDLEADAILLDGNLTPNDRSGNDARLLVERIIKTGITSKIIGFSGSEMSDYGVEVDVDPGKDMASMLNAIENL
jgi:CheY-like chemotaxis protein